MLSAQKYIRKWWELGSSAAMTMLLYQAANPGIRLCQTVNALRIWKSRSWRITGGFPDPHHARLRRYKKANLVRLAFLMDRIILCVAPVPLSSRNLAIVLKSGVSRPASRINSLLRWASRFLQGPRSRMPNRQLRLRPGNHILEANWPMSTDKTHLGRALSHIPQLAGRPHCIALPHQTLR